MVGAEMRTSAKPMYKNLKYRGDYIGMRFGKLVVIGYPFYKGVRRGGAYCRCDCGEVLSVSSMGDLFRGVVYQCRKCGRKAISEAYKKRYDELVLAYRVEAEKLEEERLRCVWSGIIQRCKSSYGPYSDVSVCEQWLDFDEFKDWALSHGYDYKAQKGECSIDRINPYGGYEPSNCRFVCNAVQAWNRRKTWDRMNEATRAKMLETSNCDHVVTFDDLVKVD